MDTPILKYNSSCFSKRNLPEYCQDSANRLKWLIKERFRNYNYGGIFITEIYHSNDRIATLVMLECKDTDRMKMITINKRIKDINAADIYCLSINKCSIDINSIVMA